MQAYGTELPMAGPQETARDQAGHDAIKGWLVRFREYQAMLVLLNHSWATSFELWGALYLPVGTDSVCLVSFSLAVHWVLGKLTSLSGRCRFAFLL